MLKCIQQNKKEKQLCQEKSVTLASNAVHAQIHAQSVLSQKATANTTLIQINALIAEHAKTVAQLVQLAKNNQKQHN